jgi:hypothetical protein
MAKDGRFRAAGLCCAAATAAVAWGASAQSAADAAAGGGVTTDAGVAAGLRFLDNVYSTENDKVSDFVAVLEPFAEVGYRGGPYQLGFRASAELGRYASETSEDYQDFLLDLETTTRLGGGFSLFGGGDLAWEHEERSSPDAVNGAEPTTYRDGGGYLGLGWRGGDVAVRAGATLRRLDYDDVDGAPPGPAVIDNDDRDRLTGEFGGRVSYRIAPERQIFAQALYDVRRYDEAPTVDRDSGGVQVALGVDGALGPLRGEAFVGLLSQDYDQPGFDRITTVDVGADLTWRPRAGSALTFVLDRSIEETTISDSSGYVSTGVGVRASQRVAPDFSVRAYAFATQNDYQQITRTDYVTELGAGLRWHYTPKVYVGLDYGFEQRGSDVAGADYDSHIVMLRAGAVLEPAFDEDAPRATAGPGEFYVGANVGDQALTTALSGVRGGADLAVDFGGMGLVGGGFAGYRAPVGPMDLGVEIDADLGGGSWSDVGNREFGVERNVGLGLSAVIGTRLANGVRLYAKAGPVATEYDSFYRFGGVSNGSSEYRLGFRSGIGAEVPVSGPWSARLEYLLTAHEDYDFGVPNSIDNFANLENAARLGLVYSFGAADRLEPQVDPAAFSGFYAGAQGGHGAVIATNTGPRGAPSVTTVTDRGSTGLTGGLFAGYGDRMGALWLGGEVEAELSGASFNIERDPLGREVSVQKTATIGAAARIGYLVGDAVMLYARGGVVNSWFDTDYATGGNDVSSTRRWCRRSSSAA